MFAHVVIHLHAALGQLAVQHLLDQSGAAAAGGGGLGAGFQITNGGGAIIDGGAQRAFGNIVAGADLGTIRQGIGAEHGGIAGGRSDQSGGFSGQVDLVQAQLQQVAIIFGVAHQYRAQ